MLRDKLIELMEKKEEGKALAQFDSNGNLISLTDKEDNLRITFIYDEYGNITEVYDNKGNYESYKYEYGNSGQVVCENGEKGKHLTTNFFVFDGVVRYAIYEYDDSRCSFNYIEDFSSEEGQIVNVDINYSDAIVSLKALTYPTVSIIEFDIFTKDRIKISYTCDVGKCITEDLIDKDYMYLWEHTISSLYDAFYINKCFENYRNGKQ